MRDSFAGAQRAAWLRVVVSASEWDHSCFLPRRCSRAASKKTMTNHVPPMYGQAFNDAPTPASSCGGKPPDNGVKTANTSPTNMRPKTLNPQSVQWRKPKTNPPIGAAATVAITAITIKRLRAIPIMRSLQQSAGLHLFHNLQIPTVLVALLFNSPRTEAPHSGR